MPIRIVRLLGILAVAIVASAGGSATRAVQMSSHPPVDDGKHVHHQPGSIVGLETPELIPTETAVGLMLRAIASMADHGESRVALYFSHVEQRGRTTISASDRQQVLLAARRYVELTDPLSSEIAAVPGRNLRVAANLWADLNRTLSPDGRAGLLVFVEQYVKRSVKILK